MGVPVTRDPWSGLPTACGWGDNARMASREGGLRGLRSLRSVWCASLLALVTACASEPPEETPKPTVQAPDAAAIEAVLARTSDHVAQNPKPLSLVWNPGHNVQMQSAIALAERGLLKVIASKNAALSCDQLEPPQGEEWMSFVLDPGPHGDFYMGRAVSPTIAFSLKGDLAAWRETYAAHSRVEVAKFDEDDEATELRVQWKRVLHNPDPPVLTTVTGSGTMPVKLCPSARALLKHEPSAPVATGPLKVRVGQTEFEPRKVLAFLFDDGKNGPIFSSFGFYASEDANCERTTRQLADEGGGVNGLQIETGQVGAAPSAMNLNIPLAVAMDINDVVTGGVFFRSLPQTPERLFGTIVLTSSGTVEAGGSVAGFIHVDGRQLGVRAADALISGSFVATICKRTYW